MGNSLDVLSGIAVGVFLLVIVVRGNSSELIALMEQDKGFLPWAIALGILFYLRGLPDATGLMDAIIVAALVGLFLTASGNIIPSATAFWKSIGGTTATKN